MIRGLPLRQQSRYNGRYRTDRARSKSDKTSTAARRANVFGIQHYAGKPFVSYAYKDSLRLELLACRCSDERAREVRNLLRMYG